MKTEEPKRILIINPDIKSVEEMVSSFSKDGYDVEVCKSITDAVGRVKDVKFNCAIIDVYLVGIMGYEAVPIIKAIDPNLEIIITADENTKELEENVRKQKIFYYHIKSFGMKELKLAVANVMKERKH